MPLLFRYPVEYAIMKVNKTQEGLKMKGMCQLLAYRDDVKFLSENKVL
jgi:hypothetical protein